MNRQDAPKDSEIPAMIWLKQIGMTEIRFVGRGHGIGPPDFIGEYRGKKIAVEVCLLPNESGWGRRKETAFEKKLEALLRKIESEEKIVPGFHWICEYDERDPLPKKACFERLKGKVRAAVLSARMHEGRYQEFQISPQDEIGGRGITLIVLGIAKKKPTFAWWGTDSGQIIEGDEVGRRVASVVREKADNVGKSERAKKHDHWWLVLDDEVTYALDILSQGCEAALLKHVREAEGHELWSKIVLLSRMRDPEKPQDSPLWFRPLWEGSENSLLPASPPPSIRNRYHGP